MSCPDGSIDWIAKIFGDCVITTRDNWSFWVGTISSLIWLFSSVPQYVQNYRTKSVEGQSPFFFMLLLVGDICCFVGLLVNHGLASQIIQSIVYLLLDGLLFSQYLYYRYVYYGCCHDHFKDHQDGQELQNEKTEFLIEGTVAAVAATNYALPYSGKELVGTIFGWVSTAIYISARFPQLKKNFQSKMVKDISPLFLILNVLGNATYLSSIWIKSTSAQYNWNQAPWIVGAGFPMLCDIAALIQMFIWGRGDTNEDDSLADNLISINSN